MKTTSTIALSFLMALCLLPGTLVAADEPAEAASADDGDILLAHFDDAKASQKRWITVNDNVMGGKSEGGPTFADGLLTFKGATNTDGGGFSSIRTQPTEIDLTDTIGLLLRVKGDGRTYMASIRTDASNGQWRIPFRAEFDTVEGEWVSVFVPYREMKPTFWGMEIRDNPPALELDKVESLGLMIYDKQDGAFELQVDWIKAVPEEPEEDSE